MIFENAYITNAGHSLLTRATAGTKIIWGKCGCYSQNLNSMSQSAINALTTLTGAVALGTSSAVFELEEGEIGKAKITCQVDNTSEEVSPGYAYSFGLWAKIEGDENEVLVVVARVGSHQATYFPAFTDATDRLIGIVDLSVVVQSGVASTINITPSGYALASNLQAEIDLREALEERVVTTHKADNEQEGDLQVILGHKAFVDGVSIGDSEGDTHGSFMLYDGERVELRLVTDGYVSSCIELNEGYVHIDELHVINSDLSNATLQGTMTVRGTIIPYANNMITLGSSDLRFEDINSETIHVDKIHPFTGTSYLEGNICPGINGSGMIGLPNMIFSGMYSNNITASNKVKCKDIEVSNTLNANSIESDTSIISDAAITSGTYIEATSYVEAGTYIEAGTYVRAGSGAGDLIGIIPKPSISGGVVSVPVGAIVCLYVTGLYTVGDAIEVTSGGVPFGTISGSPDSQHYAPQGKYIALSVVASGSVLAIRIE